MRRQLLLLLVLTTLTAGVEGQTSREKHIVVNHIAVDILEPDGNVEGDLLILPGWSYSKERWCTETDLCAQALSQGYRLILPEMHKSIYAEHYFPETRHDWRNEPTLLWLTDTLIPWLQANENIFNSGHNFAIGLSTGARGVVLCCIKTGNLFRAGGALSGDYDQTSMKSDNLMRGFYGSYEQFGDRWRYCDNPTTLIDQLQVPIYFGHGMKDRIVPPEQTIAFYNKLSQRHSPHGCQIHCDKNGGHNFSYWGSEVEAMLRFFSQFK